EDRPPDRSSRADTEETTALATDPDLTAEPPKPAPAGTGSSPMCDLTAGSEYFSGQGKDGVFRLTRPLGRRRLGEVWRARAGGGGEVAIKFLVRGLPPEEARRVVQALEALQKLQHPSVLPVQAFWEERNRLRLVTEVAEGNLLDRLQAYRREGTT